MFLLHIFSSVKLCKKQYLKLKSASNKFVMLSSESPDYLRNSTATGRLNHFYHYKKISVSNKKWLGNHHSIWPTPIKSQLCFPTNRCLKKIMQDIGLRTNCKDRQENTDKWQNARNIPGCTEYKHLPSVIDIQNLTNWNSDSKSLKKCRVHEICSLISLTFVPYFWLFFMLPQSRRFLTILYKFHNYHYYFYLGILVVLYFSFIKNLTICSNYFPSAASIFTIYQMSKEKIVVQYSHAVHVLSSAHVN